MTGDGTVTPITRFPTTLGRYLVIEFLRVFALCMASFIAIYILVDFFDRFANFMKNDATLGQILRYFLYKAPLIVTQVTPMAILASILLSLGGLSRNNEITAMHACGVSRLQMIVPLSLVCVLLGIGSLFWNETVMPGAYRMQRYVYNVEIKGKEQPKIVGSAEMWSHGEGSFFHVRLFDAKTLALLDLTIYDIDRGFRLTGLRKIPVAHWDGEAWRFESGTEQAFSEGGRIETIALGPGELDIGEKPEDLQQARRKGEEYSYTELATLVENLRRKGLDPTQYEVDLELKLALPFLCVVMALIGIPHGVRHLRSSSLSGNIGFGLLLGISYWFILALAISLGRSGALPPVIAAWAANGIFTALGIFLLLGRH